MAETEIQHLAYCGLDCTRCLAYIATKENSDEKRREFYVKLTKEYSLKPSIKPEELNCDGCLTENAGNIGCIIRTCARGKRMINCAHCREYVCEQLDKYFQAAPGCKETLDSIKKAFE
jgi:hypothetical protein